ncbi:peptidylprolyl isomerase [Gemella sp. GH3]|uniref:peptidylprolyl isomerase n=1 Tax=unclassified Gemella TaxID=2624949 RepID=UPI0015D0516D|nr:MULTISPECIES: peptidylprolyl isomerase [unclassified Gemella]MBF0714629.1 peptidylprolyl isomerase [Gemella sp. GH3.1]NYS51581.1 peptidylprolyl isomerase [Gemella sp. GH3]
MKKMKKVILPIALSASVIGLAGCSNSNSEKYITSKSGDVTQQEVLDNIGKQTISKAATDIAIKKVLLDKYKDKIDEKYIEEQIKTAQDKYGGKDKFEATLKQQGFTLDKYKEALKVRTAQAYMINDYKNVKEEQYKEAYEKDKMQYHLAHILISVKSASNPNGLSEEEAKAKAEEVLEKVKNGEDFSTLAKENSTDKSNASNGGDLGWSSKESSSFVSEFNDAAFKLQKGETSEVVKTPFGYHIIKLLDTKEVTYEEQKTQIVEKMAQTAVSQDATIYSAALKKLFEEYNVKGTTDDVTSYINDMLSSKAVTQQQ